MDIINIISKFILCYHNNRKNASGKVVNQRASLHGLPSFAVPTLKTGVFGPYCTRYLPNSEINRSTSMGLAM